MVYENVQIGNFLVGLGYALRDLNRKLYGSINLYQQTPKDQETGDVFGVLNGRYFILEFKRSEANVVDEQRKKDSQKLIKLLKESKDLTEATWLSHLMLFPSESGKELHYNVQPYLRAIEPLIVNNPISHISSSADFINEIFLNDCIIGCSTNEMKAYLELLLKCLPDKSEKADGSTSKRSSGSFGGLIFCVDPDEKKMQLMPFQNLDELTQTLKYSLSVHLGLQQEYQQQVVVKKEKEQNYGLRR